MRIISYFAMLLVVFLGLTFAVLNAEVVTFNYYLNTIKIHLSLLLILTFALGCILGMLSSLWVFLKIKITNHRLRQRLNLAEKQLINLRKVPLQDET